MNEIETKEVCGKCSKTKDLCVCGRPTEYKGEETCKKLQRYIDEAEDEELELLSAVSLKGTEMFKRKLKVHLPTIEGAAEYLDVDRNTLYNWEEIYPEFLRVMDSLRAKQARMLIENGLNGDYNPTIAKVLLTKHGYREGIEQTGAGGKDLIPDKQSKEKSDKALNDFLNGPNKKHTG